MNIELQELAPLSAAVSAAADSGLLAELTENPDTPPALAKRCNLDPRACARVIEVLDAFNLTTRNGDKRGAGPELTALGARPSPIGRKETELWRHTTTFLETGEPFVLMDAAPKEREEHYRAVVSMLVKLYGDAPDQIAAKCGVAPQAIIDVGCGSGVWSLAIARRNPSATVTGVDLPAVLTSFRELSEGSGLADRADTIEGDMHTVDLPRARWDLLVIANVLRLEPVESARKLVKRLGEAVRPGGSILVIDALADGTPEADRARAMYGLHLALRTRHGRVHSPEEISAWLSEAGFAKPARVGIDSASGLIAAVGALVAKKS